MAGFKLESKLTPQGDQPEAIRQLMEGLERGGKRRGPGSGNDWKYGRRAAANPASSRWSPTTRRARRDNFRSSSTNHLAPRGGRSYSGDRNGFAAITYTDTSGAGHFHDPRRGISLFGIRPSLQTALTKAPSLGLLDTD